MGPMDIWYGVKRAARDLREGKIPLEAAREVEREATARVASLKARAVNAPRLAYTDEIEGGEDAIRPLRAAILEADTLVVCIFRRPARRLRGARLPHLAVVRLGQVPFIELDGRQRVRDWWGLMVDGVRMAEGPKRWVMKNAQGAAMMDEFGVVERRHFLTGRARMKATYQRRRDQRRNRAFVAMCRQHWRGAHRGFDAPVFVGIDPAAGRDGSAIVYLKIGGTDSNPTIRVDTGRDPAAG